MRIALLCAGAILIMLAAILLPLPVPPYLDFQVIYHADMGLLRGISLYDHAGQVNMIAQLAKVPPEQVFVLPFPYPPWYALSTLWLARLPIVLAARAWFGLNLVMLLAAAWLLSGERPVLQRLPWFIAAVAWAPAIGSLFVGQYGFPVLLGAALMMYALHREDAILTGLAAALMTFKPHLGGLPLVLVLIYLWRRGSPFARRAGLSMLIAAGFLFAVGFLASPLWPLDYMHSIARFRDVSQCHQCTSVPMVLAALIGRGFSAAVWFAAAIAVLLLVWLILKWRLVARDPRQLLTAGVLLTLLVSPYLQNYDYLLLLVPFVLLGGEAARWEWVWLGLAFLLPLACFILLGIEGSWSLIASSVLLFAVLLARLARSHDEAGSVLAHPA